MARTVTHSPHLVDRLLRAAAAEPDRLALIDGDRAIAFRALDDDSSRAARLFAAWGVRRGDRVAIAAAKSIECTTAVWGALKAGAMFVPASVDWSPDRLAAWIADCEPTAVLVDDPALLADLAARGGGPRFETMTGFAAALAGQSPAPLPVATRSDDAAYIYYTSGTTGAPKGAVVSHAATAATIDHFVDRLGMGPADRLLNTVALHLDRSVFEIVGHATAACTNILLPRATSLSQIYDTASRLGVTVLSTAPAVLRALAAGARTLLARYPLGALRAVLFGGERSATHLLRPLLDALPDARWFQGYGTTETVMQSLLFELTRDRAGNGECLPLGHPFPDTRVALLGDDGAPVPRGQRGEVVLAGRTMLGYWRQPEKTRAQLRPVRFPDGATLSAWFTGDLAYEDSAGDLVFCGRRDNLVKLRGERVQLEELDAALAGLPGVADGGALSIETPAAGAQILGLVAVRDPAAFEAGRADLPRSLTPDRILVVPEIPRGPGGKIDRAALRRVADAHRGTAP